MNILDNNLNISKTFFVILIIGFFILSGNLGAITIGAITSTNIVPTTVLYSFISILSTIIVGFTIYIFKNLISSIKDNTISNKTEHKELDSKLDGLLKDIHKIEKDRIQIDNNIDVRLSKVEVEIKILNKSNK